MDQKVTAAVLVAFLVVSVCITTVAAADRPYFLIDTQHIGNLREAAATAPILLGASLHSNSTHPLDQPTRQQIYIYIKANPGVHFRGICNGLGLSIGEVQYHLSVLEHANLIKPFADGQNKRYFENNSTYTKANMQLISLLRHETTGKILNILAQNGAVLHKDIACNVGISPQALSWQMNQLKKAGLINAEKTGVNVRYNFINEVTCNFIVSLIEKSKI